MKSWIKAFIITPIVTWIVSFAIFNLSDGSTGSYVLSQIPAGLVSGALFCYLVPKYKLFVSTCIFALLYYSGKYLLEIAPPVKFTADWMSAYVTGDIVFVSCASFGVIVSLLLQAKSRKSENANTALS